MQFPNDRYRVSRARLTYAFERYAIADELISVGEASAFLGISREAIALLVLQGRLAVVEPVEGPSTGGPRRLLLRREVETLEEQTRERPLPFA